MISLAVWTKGVEAIAGSIPIFLKVAGATTPMEEATTTKPSGAPIRQFSVMLQNRAGEMEALIKLLHQGDA